jgi:hypothetical protein
VVEVECGDSGAEARFVTRPSEKTSSKVNRPLRLGSLVEVESLVGN